MSQPLVVSIPHRLGREEAVRRLKSGLGSVRTNYGQLLAVQEEIWTGDHLQFRVSALGQVAAGSIDVADDHVRLEVTLPWLLAKIAERFTPAIRKEGAQVGYGRLGWREPGIHNPRQWVWIPGSLASLGPRNDDDEMGSTRA